MAGSKRKPTKSTKATPVQTLPPAQTPQRTTTPNAFDIMNRPLNATEAMDLNAFGDYSNSGFTGTASSANLPTIKAMQNKMRQFGWGSLDSYQGSTNPLTQELKPEDLTKSGAQSGKNFSIIAPTMISEAIKRAKLLKIDNKAAFLQNADIIFKGINDDVRNSQFFKNIAPDFYKVAANIYEDRLRNFRPPSATVAPATPTVTPTVTPTATPTGM